MELFHQILVSISENIVEVCLVYEPAERRDLLHLIGTNLGSFPNVQPFSGRMMQPSSLPSMQPNIIPKFH